MSGETTHFQRFWRRVKQQPNGCWLWSGAVTAHGYGNLRQDKKYLRAHRYSYTVFKGPIDDEMFVCHACDVKLCVNPDHLYAGTPAQNTRDAIARGLFNPAAHRVHRGEDNRNSKLTEPDIRQIRAMAAKGTRQRDIAKHFGVSQSGISKIIRRTAWTHVE